MIRPMNDEIKYMIALLKVIAAFGIIVCGLMAYTEYRQSHTVENSSNNSELPLEKAEFGVMPAVWYYIEPEKTYDTLTTRVYESIESRAEVTLCAVPTMKIVVPRAIVKRLPTVNS